MKKLLQQALDALDSLEQNYGNLWQFSKTPEELDSLLNTIRAELEKPEQEPEPVAYMLTTRNFGLGGETWDTTEYRDYPWDSDCVPLYTKGATNADNR